MRVEIKVLGPLQGSVDGTSIVPSARKQRQVLAMLAINTGQVVTASALIEEIWGGRPPRLPLASLQTYILHLRRKVKNALAEGADRSSKDILLTGPGGYTLDVPAGHIDTGQYEQLVASGRRAVSLGDYHSAARILGDALKLWRGRALVDVVVGPLLQIERTRLEESRLSTLDLRIDADLRLGRHRLLLDELAALCAKHPWFENFHAQYMLALHRSGLPWRALEVYRRLHTSVGRHLGVDPSRQLRQLHQAILSADPLVDDPRFVASDWQLRKGA
ncbi:AfsR/SARP family transcriptional regulator [Actinophytocola sp.]|uniref:AfsR/SARP family transcriptional regulator n=1 Tax=Actinophytocola sp. TaxID=1872138 RepID=UPI002D7F42FB|nr:AfsR/SARP family transcriptional regulator [Actinophytocola sp.]HET9142298.1 AfsR/SARP family transcriptional regulator [Actinophytocola sp.]HEU5111020.1 AfsR/SARP family transcriptional regulator [Micromonosporaceae bacterium]